MNTLIIQHVSTNPDKFEVLRLTDGKRTQPVEIPAPTEFPVQGRPDSNLSRELRWYIESFLDYPFEPDTDVAERVQDSLKKWGETAFNALFDNREGGKMLDDIARNGYDKLHLKISADDPRILAWNWEALSDPKAGTFAHLCQIERKLNQILDPVPLSKKLPQDCVNILLVTARPFENDVSYRSISRLLVELIESKNLPAQVHVLRPPMFDNLREHLRKHPNFYHILHFDGHGAYGNVSPESISGFTFKGKEGCLAFETEDGKEDLILTEQLSALLREHAVPAVVLNACQSGMIDENAKDPFASVAASLLKSGVRSVAAMAYSLYVSGAQVFLPEFYRILFATGSMEKAVRAGRQQMFSNPKRVCVRGKFPLQDWLVPVLYQQESFDFSFASQAKPKAAPISLPSEIADEENPYGFIGRDKPILELERAMRLKTPAILIHGLGGVGKTTLAKGFVKWLSQTQGLGNGCFWFAFNDIHNAESVLNRMGEALFGGNFALASVEERMNALISAFRENRFIIVWDNFESVRGIDGTEVKPLMDNEQQALLALFLKKLRNGQTKVIITSRSEEEWIKTERRRIDISGLDGEERWLFLNEIVRSLGIDIRQDDPDLKKLMDMLNGHPLSMRVMIPMLEKQSAKALITALQTDFDVLKQENDESAAKLYATLGLAQKALPEELRPLLILLGLHERFIHLYYFEIMAKQVNENWSTDKIRRFADSLSYTGLLHDRGQNIYELHPALTGYLRAFVIKSESESIQNEWTKAFVDMMGGLAESLVRKEPHEQRIQFHFFCASFYYATNLARRVGMDLDYMAILQALAVYALHTRNYKESDNLLLQITSESYKIGKYKKIEASEYSMLKTNIFEISALDRAEICGGSWKNSENSMTMKYHQLGMEAATYNKLGNSAFERRDLDDAEKWIRKSLNISEPHGFESATAINYHQLGTIAFERRDLVSAEEWYYKAFKIKNKPQNEHSSADTCHMIGVIALTQRNFDTAEKWFQKSLDIYEKYKIKHGKAMTYHCLGILAFDRQDLKLAEKWYCKALKIKEEYEDECSMASTYYELGMIAMARYNVDEAKEWYIKSLNISEKYGTEYGTAMIYHQLGIIAQYKKDVEAAERWYQKAIEISKKYKDEHIEAGTYGQLGRIAIMQKDFEKAGNLLIKAILLFEKYNDKINICEYITWFILLYKVCDSEAKAKLMAMWLKAGMGRILRQNIYILLPILVAKNFRNILKWFVIAVFILLSYKMFK